MKSKERGNRTMKMMKCILVVFLLVGALLPTFGETAENAVSKYNRAVRFYEAGGMNNTKQAFMLLWDAWCATSDRNMKKTIESMLQRAYNQYCDEVREHVYLLNDDEWEEEEDFYDKLISYGENARAYRLKGILLAKRKKFDEALSCLAKADNGGDSEAAFWISGCYAEGLGCEKNPKLAFQWLERGVLLGSPLCNYWMGKMLWNCNYGWGAPDNRSGDAIQYLDEALKYIKRWTLYDAQKEKERTWKVWEMERAIEYLKVFGKNPELFEQASGLKYFQPTLFTLELDVYEETSLHRVYQLLVEKGINLNPPGTHVEVDHIKLVPASTHPNCLGLAERRYPDNRTVMNKITIFLDELPSFGNTSQQYWWRRMLYHNTLVHEMAHVFFSQRYKAIPEFGSDLNCKRTYEGHATNSAYMFIRWAFFRGHLTPEEYAEMFLSDEYKQYFIWFRDECMSPGEDVYWGKIDKWEREAARELGYKDIEVITRKQVPWKE